MDAASDFSGRCATRKKLDVRKGLVVSVGLLTIFTCSIVIHIANHILKHSLEHVKHSKMENVVSALSQCQSICTSEQCINAASYILRRIDTNVDPCDDFYSFACGNYPEDNIVFENDLPFSDFFFLTDITSDNGKRLLLKNWEKTASEISENLYLKREKLYHNCIDKKTSDLEAVPTLLNFVSNTGIPNWPHLNESWSLIGTNMEQLISKFSATGLNAFCVIVLAKSSEEDTHQDVYLRPGEPFLEDCENDKTVIVKQFLEDFLIELGMSKNESHDLVNVVTKIDLRLAQGKDSEEVSYNAKKFIDCKGIDLSSENWWCRLVRHHSEESGWPLHDAVLNLTLSKQGWFDDVEDIFREFSERILAHYLAIHFILDNEEHLGVVFRKQGLSVSTLSCERFTYLDVPVYEERSNWCMKWLAHYVSPMLRSDYVKTHITKTQMNEAQQVLSHIRQFEISRIRNATCLPESVSDMLLFNINVTSLGLDFFYKYEKEKNITESMYAELSVTGNNFIENCLEFRRFLVRMDLKHQTRYFVLDLSPNQLVFGASSGERINVQFGVFQRPIFNPGQPRYIDFGNFGFIIGHETIHNIFMELKFLPEDVTPVNNFTQCLTAQYSKYELPYQGINVNGYRTIDENIADFFGINVAFEAYQKFKEDHGKDPKLPGLDFSNEQLFFISAGQFLCEFGDRITFEKYKKMSHSPMKYRVHGSMVNSEAFSTAFNCPVESPMNPSKKCSLMC